MQMDNLFFILRIKCYTIYANKLKIIKTNISDPNIYKLSHSSSPLIYCTFFFTGHLLCLGIAGSVAWRLYFSFSKNTPYSWSSWTHIKCCVYVCFVIALCASSMGGLIYMSELVYFYMTSNEHKRSDFIIVHNWSWSGVRCVLKLMFRICLCVWYVRFYRKDLKQHTIRVSCDFCHFQIDECCAETLYDKECDGF